MPENLENLLWCLGAATANTIAAAISPAPFSWMCGFVAVVYVAVSVSLFAEAD
jgi:hypothetical protein